MSWNLQPQGVNPTQGAVNFSGGLSPTIRTGNATADAINEAIKAVGEILQERRRDKIANQLLAVDNAPKAVAVDGTQPGSGTPDTALTSAMVQQNLNATYGGTQQGGFPTQDSGKVPDMGGVDALQTSDLIRKRLQSQQSDALDLQLTQAKINHLEHPVLRASGAGTDKPITPLQQAQIDHWQWMQEHGKGAGTLPTEQAPPAAAIEYLKQHPEAAPDFEAKYGPGTSQQFL